MKFDCIEPSQSPHYSQVHLVEKTNGTWRFCIDFRGLNDSLKSFGWPIPNIRVLLQRLREKRAKYFASMDLTSGYFQAPIATLSRKYTAFISDDGVYQWKRVPMGIKCTDSYFQQQMQLTLRGLLDDCCFLYLDDVIIFGRTEAEYLSNVDKVFRRLREKKVILSPTKYKCGLTEV